jgi:hypothetical protein
MKLHNAWPFVRGAGRSRQWGWDCLDCNTRTNVGDPATAERAARAHRITYCPCESSDCPTDPLNANCDSATAGPS